MTLFDSILDRSAVNNTTLFRVQPKTTDATQQPFASEDSARQLDTENTSPHEGPVGDARIQKTRKRKRNDLSKEEQNKAPKIIINSADTGTLSSRGKSKATRPAEDTEATQQEARDTAGAAEPELVDGAAGMDNEDPDQLERTIFVGNLPATLKKKRLVAIFSKFGEIESVRFRSVPLKLDEKQLLPRRAAILSQKVCTDRGSMHAYIVFKNAASAQASLSLNMSEVEQRHIRVDMATQARSGKDTNKAPPLYDTSCTVFVGNLPFDVDDEELIGVFNDIEGSSNSVSAVRAIRDRENNLGKGIAYVMFKEKSAARMALAKDGVLLRKRPLRVTRVSSSRSQPAPSGSRRKTPPAKVKPSGALGRLEKKRHSSTKGQLISSAESWQGQRTKGVKKLIKPAAAAKGAARGSAGGTAAVNGAGRAKKRPAVAARKARLSKKS